ncbi:kelch-like protein, partial [Corallococcus sp. AB018]
ELYDVAQGTWKTVASMNMPRYLPHATALTTGRVLVVTGEGGSGLGVLDSSEVYDVAMNAWTPAGIQSTRNTHHGLALLPSGRVLVAGGSGSGGARSAVDVYTPAP